ncbi:TPA: hypothetical protein ACNZ88_000743 [Enterobacter kobei]|uniref:hypothetical protein n=1 Tax=Enterobacter kobei TaxID=208224 RepID=UPI003B87E1E4
MKTHEMAFGMGFFWFVLLPSPLHSFKSLVTSSLYLEQQASVLADYFFLLVYGISNKFTSGERYNFAYHIQTDKSETHLVTADISYPGK